MKVLPNRKCGQVKQGLYAVGGLSPAGTLLPFTALVAPIPAEISNPRRTQKVGIAETLLGEIGLQPPSGESFAGLPPVGVADLWGKSAGYETVWDVISETKALGVSRRIANVPDLQVPYPVLMMHMNAGVFTLFSYAARWETIIPAWFEKRRLQPFVLNDVQDLWHQPFLKAESLGIKDDDDFMDHPYVKLYTAIHELRKAKLYNEFQREFGIYTEQGIFGLSWITSICYVLGEDETEVPPALARKGVEAAVGEDDPRACEADVWDQLGEVVMSEESNTMKGQWEPQPISKDEISYADYVQDGSPCCGEKQGYVPIQTSRYTLFQCVCGIAYKVIFRNEQRKE